MVAFLLGKKNPGRVHCGVSMLGQDTKMLVSCRSGGQLLSAAFTKGEGQLTTTRECQQGKKETKTRVILPTHQTTLPLSACFFEGRVCQGGERSGFLLKLRPNINLTDMLNWKDYGIFACGEDSVQNNVDVKLIQGKI